ANAIQRERYQTALEYIQAQQNIVGEQYRLAGLQNTLRHDGEISAAKHRAELLAIEREQQVADAKAKADIAQAERSAENAKNPPSPSPVPPPQTAEEKRAQRRKEIQDEMERLADEEAEAIGRATGGKPDSEWSKQLNGEI